MWKLRGPGTIVLALAMAGAAAAAIETRLDAFQAIVQRKIPGVLVAFDFDQTTPTKDEIVILFSNAAVDLRRAPQDEFGPYVAQFSFSGRDFPKPNSRVSFTRRTGDRSFLNCRYIRVVNRGTSAWVPSNISLTVDGQRILDRVSMYPRKGASSKEGIARWDRRDAVFWETELFRYYRPSKVY